jgi:hypothetical protein
MEPHLRFDASNAAERNSGARNRQPSLLTGMLVDDDGNRMTPSHAVKKGTRYRYYVSRPLITKDRTERSAGLRIPAGEIEQLANQTSVYTKGQRQTQAAGHLDRSDRRRGTGLTPSGAARERELATTGSAPFRTTFGPGQPELGGRLKSPAEPMVRGLFAGAKRIRTAGPTSESAQPRHRPDVAKATRTQDAAVQVYRHHGALTELAIRVGPRVRIRLAPAGSLRTSVPRRAKSTMMAAIRAPSSSTYTAPSETRAA